MKKILWLLLVVFFVQCTNQPQNQKKIGIVLSLSDRGATYGVRALNGIQIAADEIKDSGDSISIIIEDSKSDAKTALSAFQKLVTIDKVSVIVGMVLSDEVLTCAPYANTSHTVLFTPAAGSEEIIEAGDYVFRNRSAAFQFSDTLASYCKNILKLNEILILHSNSANGVSYANGFEESAKKYNLKITNSIGYDEDKTDYRTIVEKMKKENPQAVYLAGLDTELGIILRQCKEMNFKPQFIGSPGVISQKLIEIAGDGTENLIAASSDFDINSNDTRIKTFVSEYSNKYNSSPDWIAANSYDAIKIIYSLLQKGLTTGEEIKNGLYKLDNFPGITGLTNFDNNGEVSKKLTLKIVKNSKFIDLN